MSTDRPPAPVADDRHESDTDADHDPYGIVPEGFVANYNASSIPEALDKAEQAASRTPTDEMRRCPECGSVRIRIKPGAVAVEHQRDEAYKCDNCPAHFDEPAPSREEAAPGEQVTFDEVRR